MGTRLVSVTGSGTVDNEQILFVGSGIVDNR
jgi:hypothetical protein